jgi:alanine-glyoxylate transaminase / (R)-3-amino-2-methylpropionate-pyruvate transaminase
MNKSEEIIKKRSEFLFFNNAYFYKNPPVIVRGKMQYLYDEKGKEYLDMFAGVSVMNCGHSNDEIIDKIKHQLDKLQHTCAIYLTEPIAELAEKMAEVLPGNIKRTFFVNSGSEATEGALLLAKLYSGKDKFIYIKGGLHGRTYLGMSVTGIDMWRGWVDETKAFMAESFYPDIKQNDFDVKSSSENSLNSIKKILNENKGKIAALIIEPVQGNAGILTPNKDYFIKLKKILEANDVLLICDEVQTGFARTGEMFAIKNFKVNPDIMVMAKALGNGTPIGAFSTTDKIAKGFNKPSASTLGGNPISATAGLAVLDYTKKHDLNSRANRMGELLIKGLKKLHGKYDFIRDVRGKGLMVGAELVDKNNQPMDKLTDEILEKMKDKGIIIGKNGLKRNVLAFQPPLVIKENDIEKVISTLDTILKNKV